jgi:predicted methyltransferase
MDYVKKDGVVISYKEATTDKDEKVKVIDTVDSEESLLDSQKMLAQRIANIQESLNGVNAQLAIVTEKLNTREAE